MKPAEIVFEWKIVSDGVMSRVEEYVDGVMQISYGPMPAEMTGPFIAECRARIKTIFTRLYGETDG